MHLCIHNGIFSENRLNRNCMIKALSARLPPYYCDKCSRRGIFNEKEKKKKLEEQIN